MKRVTIVILAVLFLFSIKTFARSADEPAGERRTPAIISAIYNNNYRLVYSLIRKRHNVNVIHNGLTAVQHATTMRNLPIIKLLVRNGAKVNMKNEHGQTALAFAKNIGDKRIIRYLKSVGGR